MKHLFIFVFTALAILPLYGNVDAMCVVNQDWPDAPCFDTIPVNRDEYRKAWAPYYEYKGAEFMEKKRTDLVQAVKDGTFMEWENSIENSNVYHYYHSIGVVPNQYDYFFFEEEMIWHMSSFSIFPVLILIASIIAGVTALTVVVIKTFKK